jgi:CubicO group peptidase (beta-lactamase class C family)
MGDDALRDWLDRRVADHEFSGVALVWRDGAPLFSYAGGLAHRGHEVPVTETTRFAVASVTKLVTATAALRLVERGLLSLDQPLIEILPRNRRPAAMTPAHTLHHLLSHTSGLTNYHDDDDPTPASFTSNWDRVPMYHMRRPADILPLFADLPARFPPGTAYRYADANFILVGLAIEAVTGRAYGEVMAQEVLGPARMTDTLFGALDMEPDRLATGYLVTDGPPESWRANIYSVPVASMPDGGMITTAHDLARLIDALLGGELLGPPALAAMTSPQWPPSEELERYGYGCELVVEHGEVTILGHGGQDPGISTMVSHHRATATTTVVLCNHDRGSWAVTQRLEREAGIVDLRV